MIYIFLKKKLTVFILLLDFTAGMGGGQYLVKANSWRFLIAHENTLRVLFLITES